MALLASPSTAQITVDTWALFRSDDAAVDFTFMSTNEVAMSYAIGTGKTPTMTLYASSDCTGTDAITEAGMATISSVGIVTGSTLDIVTVAIDIDKTKIVASNIWTGSALQFCVEVKLESGLEVITKE